MAITASLPMQDPTLMCVWLSQASGDFPLSSLRADSPVLSSSEIMGERGGRMRLPEATGQDT